MRFYFSILICLFFSCFNSIEKPPTEMLTEKKFIKILKEIHLAEASLEMGGIYNKKNNPEKIKNYHHLIYQKNNVAEIDFKNTLKYYAKNPQKLEEIYSEILSQLTAERSTLDQQ